MTNSWSLLYDELYGVDPMNGDIVVNMDGGVGGSWEVRSDLTQEEVEELRSKKQELTQYGKDKIRELLTHEEMLEEAAKREVEMKHPEQNPDEIVLEDVKMFHLESMNERSLWVGVYTQDGKIYHLNISAVGDKLSYWWSDETCD